MLAVTRTPERRDDAEILRESFGENTLLV